MIMGINEIIDILKKVNKENRKIFEINESLGLNGKVYPEYITSYKGYNIQKLKCLAIKMINNNEF